MADVTARHKISGDVITMSAFAFDNLKHEYDLVQQPTSREPVKKAAQSGKVDKPKVSETNESTENVDESASSDDDKIIDPELDDVRREYEDVTGLKPHYKAGVQTLKDKIAAARAEKAAQSGNE